MVIREFFAKEHPLTRASFDGTEFLYLLYIYTRMLNLNGERGKHRPHYVTERSRLGLEAKPIGFK